MPGRARGGCARPIIGALNGSAVGIGLTFPMQWDIRIVNADAKYGFVFTRRGLTPGAELLVAAARSWSGAGAALELLLTGRIFTGAEAQSIGAGHRGACPATTCCRGRGDRARHRATTPRLRPSGVTKQLFYAMLGDTDRESAFYREWEAFRWMGRGSDSSEGGAVVPGQARACDSRRPNMMPLPESAVGWLESPMADTVQL